MAGYSSLCLNMIVKNEMANLERCLEAVAPYISCWVIGDTGSTDGTQQFIRSFFAARGLPGELHAFPFENFEQARNAALRCAYACDLPFDYILLDDADMELVVEAEDFRSQLQAAGYQLLQRSTGGLKYWNTRLVRRDAGAWYHGVTHEYLDVPGGVQRLRSAWYRDHASGANRVDKFDRDVQLLKGALEKDPDNTRHLFYLAQSYQDGGRLEEAAQAYARRAAAGGWVEEAWVARVRLARCLREMGDEAGFVGAALAAYNERPSRAEPLYDLARHYRIKGANHLSTLFSERGLELCSPDEDILFVEDWIYRHGLREEFSIAANYAKDRRRKDRGFAVCDGLALDRSVPETTRNLARSNLRFYLSPLAELMPSFTAKPVGFTPPDGYRPTNPSIARQGDALLLVQRAVNYRIDEQYAEGDIRRYPTSDNAPIHTRNFLLRLDPDLSVRSAAEIRTPADMPEPGWPLVQGFEDLRPFVWRDALWCTACIRELNAEGWCEQVLARIVEDPAGDARLADWRVLRPEGPQQHEKNWMPQVSGDVLNFIYLCDPTRIVDDQACTVEESSPAVRADQFRGGSQLLAFDGGWLALVHEARVLNGGGREYRHRFVWFDAASRLKRLTQPFCFHGHGVEFAAGLAWHPDGERLVVTYGIADSEAWIATLAPQEVRSALGDLGQPPAVAAGPSQPAVAATPPPVASSGAEVASLSTKETFLRLAPFLEAAESPTQRRAQSRAFDGKIAEVLSCADPVLPQIHLFYEVLSPSARHEVLIAATASMRRAGHPVQVWSYSPERLDFLSAYGVDLKQAADVVPRALFDRIMAGSEIRYFSDIFRYAVLYEHGGLWMDGDVVLLRPFAFRGEHFFNLQWRSGPREEHFVCGNVIGAPRYSRHLRNLYELSLARFFEASARTFGDVGPKLLSDYIASEDGAELRNQVFSPQFFNAIDWTESDCFRRPVAELADYLNDERVFGVHLWTARHDPQIGESRSLISRLSDPLAHLPSFTDLADRFDTDKNHHTGNRHAYARVYDQLLASRRFSMRRLMEIGLCRGLAEGNQGNTPLVQLWQAYFPFVDVTGLDLTDFSALNTDRFKSFVCDQSRLADLRKVAGEFAPASFDVIIDDGSHASYDQQLTLKELFPLLCDGGWYFIEDLDWQPPGEQPETITLTKTLLREIQQYGAPRSIDPLGIGGLMGEIAEIIFFDSHYELARARLLGGLVAIRKRGGSGLVR